MAISLPNGATVAIASSYVAGGTISALSNANPAVATATNTLSAGDFIEVTSGWSRLNEKVVRVPSSGLSGSSFKLDEYDTSLTSIYPAGGGAGSFRKIGGWTQLSQVLSSSSSGGEQQFLEYQLLESDAQKRIPTFKSAAGLTLSIADDPTLAGYILASQANDDRLARAVKVTLPSGAIILYNAYISLNKTPSLSVNEIMAVQVTLSFLNEPIRYAA